MNLPITNINTVHMVDILYMYTTNVDLNVVVVTPPIGMAAF